ncbi:MAG: hypothetical protein QNL04_01915 [SAR324 cluster bacterium]|nr:hypothetical protein [SAR324 cluster bacterium]
MELNQREKLLAGLALGILVPVLLLRFVIFPFFDYKSSLGPKIIRLQGEIVAIKELGLDYKRTSQKSSQGRVNQKVEAILTKLGLRSEAVLSSRADESGESATLKVDNLKMAQLVELFFYIENTSPLKIKIANVTHSYKNEKRLSLDLIITGGR